MKSKLVSVLFSVVLAFSLWLYVINAVSPGSKEYYYNIPIVMEGESVLNERGLMITGVSAQTVTMQLSGNRSDLSKVNSGNITLKADLSKIYEPGEQIVVNYTTSFPGNVASNAFVIESKNPSALTVNVERRLTKSVPVEIAWNGSVPEGYITDRENRVLDFPNVRVTGPESVVNQIAAAGIEVDLTDRRESLSENFLYTLLDANGEPVDAELITTNAEQIHLDMKIQRVKDVALVYTLLENGGATKDNAEITLTADTIRVSGSEAALDLLGDAINVGTIDLGEITQRTQLVFPISLPDEVTNLTGTTEVQADIRLNGLSTREFTIEEFSTLNIPDGLKAEIITEKLAITVRGPSAKVTALTADDIQVTVDFASAEVGAATYKVTVTFAEGFEDIGVILADTISASFSE